MQDLFELSREEKLDRVERALSAKQTELDGMAAAFEEATAGLTADIQSLKGLQAELTPQPEAAEAPADETPEVTEL